MLRAQNGKVERNNLDNLSLFWCQGDYTDKADILFWLLEPDYAEDSQPILDIENPNWDPIFKALIRIAFKGDPADSSNAQLIN